MKSHLFNKDLNLLRTHIKQRKKKVFISYRQLYKDSLQQLTCLTIKIGKKIKKVGLNISNSFDSCFFLFLSVYFLNVHIKLHVSEPI